MNKRFTSILLVSLCLGTMLSSCMGGDPHKKGIAAGKEACECYKLESLDEVEACIAKVEKDYEEFLTDTAFTNAVESQIIECISQQAHETGI